MTETVKRTRRYESSRRKEQAAATRQAILESAEALFLENGYVATPVPAIAERADVALKTVYVTFETKANLLRALWADRLAADESEIEVTDRRWFRELMAASDPEVQLRLLARHSATVKARSGRLMEAIRDAASSDETVAALWAEIQAKLLHVHRSIARHLAEKQALKDGLNGSTATDILWVLNHPSVWNLFSVERGWSKKRYEKWLGDCFVSELLGPPTEAGRST